ncbi:OLC1v1001856C1 [Oldenlandia corymbosa var. corymbosa]|uniref:OLC1v1001856C1 n=1 Tax=Oldenlandia corymbosa var. corymbosa TaxID=529605 RepID=A0AAV1D6A7_OLDCO|nr:OLC1v1001856C1 [Oldenlandia corymbosa var. corymbosa]
MRRRSAFGITDEPEKEASSHQPRQTSSSQQPPRPVEGKESTPSLIPKKHKDSGPHNKFLSSILNKRPPASQGVPFQSFQAVAAFGKLARNLDSLVTTNEQAVAEKTDELKHAKAEIVQLQEERSHWKKQAQSMKKKLDDQSKIKAHKEAMAKVEEAMMPKLRESMVLKSDLYKYILAALRVYLNSLAFARGVNQIMTPVIEMGMRQHGKLVGDALHAGGSVHALVGKYTDEAIDGATSQICLCHKGRKFFRDADMSGMKFFEEICKVCPTITSPEDLLQIAKLPSFLYKFPDDVGSTVSTPLGPDEEAELMARQRRESLESGQLSGDASRSTTSGTNNLEFSNSIFGTEDFAKDEEALASIVDAGVSPERALIEPSLRGETRLSNLEGRIRSAIKVIQDLESEALRANVVDLKKAPDSPV